MTDVSNSNGEFYTILFGLLLVKITLTNINLESRYEVNECKQQKLSHSIENVLNSICNFYRMLSRLLPAKITTEKN